MMMVPDAVAMMMVAIVMVVVSERRSGGGEGRDNDYDGHGDLFHNFALCNDGAIYEQMPCHRLPNQ